MSWKQRRFARHCARSCGRSFFAAGVRRVVLGCCALGGLWLCGGSAQRPRREKTALGS